MTTRQVRNWIVAVVLGFAATTAAFAAGELRRRSGEELGGLDFYEYCTERYGSRSTPTLLAANVWGWRCVVPGRVTLFEPIEISEACTVLHHVDAVAHFADEASPYSWRCYRA